MIVENESNWRTEDLEALLKSMMEQREFELDTGIHNNTLILFKTSCKKDKKDRYDGETLSKAPVADYESWSERYDCTRLILIQSMKKLEMEPLDRLAHIGDVVQHMSSENVRKLAMTTWRCLARRGGYDSRTFDFTEKLNMRTRSKITRSKIAIQREIDAIYWRKQKVLRESAKKIKRLEAREDALKLKL